MGPEKFIGFMDEPQAFLLPDRAQARLLWTADGFVEYVFANTAPATMGIVRAELSMEVCSECQDFNNDYPSDITVWMNGVEIGTWNSPGGRRGRLNPSWWSDHNTQYGLLKVWSTDSGGSLVDGHPVSAVTVGDAQIVPRTPVVVRIGVKPDAVHRGGFNLFGRGFGNYDQDLILRLHYKPKDKDEYAFP